MCGRFGIYADKTKLEKMFHIENFVEYSTSYNIAPTQQVPVVLNNIDQRMSALLAWGLIPAWAKEEVKPQINARVESVAEKPFFRSAFKSRRCLVPASCWFEWRVEESSKQPYCFQSAEGSPLAIAGIWEHWAHEDESIYTFALITRDANKQCSEIHTRMPLIVAPENFDLWLDVNKKTVAELEEVISPRVEPVFKIFAVSKRVNSPRNNDRGCVEPV